MAHAMASASSSTDSLHQHARQPLPQRGVHHHVHGADHSRDVPGGDESGEDHPVPDSELGSLGGQPFPQDAVAHEEEPGAPTPRHDLRRRPENELVALEFEQARDLADDDVALLEPEPAPYGLPGSVGIAIGVDVHAAVDDGEASTRPNARLPGLFDHRLRDAHDAVRDERSSSFRGDERGVDDGRRIGVERQALDRVDNDGHAQESGGETPQDAGL